MILQLFDVEDDDLFVVGLETLFLLLGIILGIDNDVDVDVELDFGLLFFFFCFTRGVDITGGSGCCRSFCGEMKLMFFGLNFREVRGLRNQSSFNICLLVCSSY